MEPTDGSHRWISFAEFFVVDSAVASAVEKLLVVVVSCLVDPVAGWGYFISKCWRERSTGVIVAENQFTNEI